MTKKCVICGKTFEAHGRDKTCGKECRATLVKVRRTRRKNTDAAREYNRNWMREYRKRNKLPERREDTLVGLNYAERQKRKSLELAGKIQV